MSEIVHSLLTRRQAFQRAALATVAVAGGALLPRLQAQVTPPPAPAAPPAGPFKLPPLPYATDALEPIIDACTMEIHHDKHHAAYVAGLNKAVADHPALGAMNVDELMRKLDAVPESVRTAVRNMGGGHANHSLFWLTLKKNNGTAPGGELARALDQKFGSFATFQQEFTKAAMAVFGSGWAWLSWDGKALRIETSPNQDTPLSQGRTPLLGIDVWEHAYYLKYQNRRADYVAAFQGAINWDFVADRFKTAQA